MTHEISTYHPLADFQGNENWSSRIIHGGPDLSLILQDGTGAVARLLHDKIKSVVSPVDFAAVGDGVANDQAFFTLLETAFTTPRIVDLEGRTYLVTTIPTGHHYRNGTFKVGATLYPTGLVRAPDLTSVTAELQAITNKLEYLAPVTGGVSRPLNDKLSDVLSPKDFGAGCEGDTDDTEALQAFLDHHVGTTAFIPDGSYNISDTLVLPSGTNLVMGDNATITAIDEFFAMIMTSGEHRNGLISGGQLRCNPTGLPGDNYAEVGLWLKFAGMIRVKDVEIWDNNQYGILLGDLSDPGNFIYEVFMQNLQIRRSLITMPVNSHGVYWAEGGDCHMSNSIIMGNDYGVGGAIWNTHFDRVHIWTPLENGIGSVGFYLAGGGNTLSQCQVDGPTVYGIQVVGDDNFVSQAKYLMPDGYNATDNAAWAVWVEPGQRATIVNSFFCGGSASYRIAAGVGGADLSQVTETGNITLNATVTAVERSRSGARAYIKFMGATPGSWAGMNIYSVTDNGVGDFTITFAHAMPTATFAVSATTDWTDGAATIREVSRTTSTLRVEVLNSAGTKVDGMVQITVHDLH